VVNNKTRATILARISVLETINFNIIAWCSSYYYYYYTVPSREYNAAGRRNTHYSSEFFRNPFVSVVCYIIYCIFMYTKFIYMARARLLLLFIITLPPYMVSNKWPFFFGIAFTLIRGLVVCGIVSGIRIIWQQALLTFPYIYHIYIVYTIRRGLTSSRSLRFIRLTTAYFYCFFMSHQYFLFFLSAE